MSKLGFRLFVFFVSYPVSVFEKYHLYVFLHINANVGYFFGRWKPILAYTFVQLLRSQCRPRFFEVLIFRFLARFWTLKKFHLYVCMHLNANLGYTYLPIDTKFCIQVCLGRYRFLQSLFFLPKFLDFEIVAFIRVYAPYCLCGPYLFANCYHILPKIFLVICISCNVCFFLFCFYIDFGLWN